jgi:hypothetical protein
MNMLSSFLLKKSDFKRTFGPKFKFDSLPCATATSFQRLC